MNGCHTYFLHAALAFGSVERANENSFDKTLAGVRLQAY
ncbi:hypothetical protein CKA32_004405 [Geitlerinema sp. FC II]|nr:hypothetical protein CKA32_004405 [Geitlerinema sp. FC II]